MHNSFVLEGLSYPFLNCFKAGKFEAMPLPIGESPGKPESPAGFLAALQVDADLSRHHVIRMQLEGD